jgi:hypothetical protein
MSTGGLTREVLARHRPDHKAQSNHGQEEAEDARKSQTRASICKYPETKSLLFVASLIHRPPSAAGSQQTDLRSGDRRENR